MAMGLLLVLLQPPIHLSWAFHSDLIRAAHQSADDISIYVFVASKPMWPSWLLIAAILLTLAAVTFIIPVKYMVEMRTFYALGFGISLGIYISAEYSLVVTTILQALVVVIMICASVIVVFTHFPSALSTKFLPWVFALLVALFPVTYLLEGQDVHGHHDHKSYYGDRDTDTLVATMESLVVPIPKESDKLSLENKNDNTTDNTKRPAPMTGGCRIEGFLRVKKVPGNLVVSARSEAHSFDPSQINMSHIVTQLSYGKSFLEDVV
ncbi:hypothetical protein OROGR_021641 [Orobanche gracilis]